MYQRLSHRCFGLAQKTIIVKSSMAQRALIITLGCRLNHADTALLSARLKNAGYELCSSCAEKPDLIVLNSCAITAEAERKSRQQIRKLRKAHPSARIAVAGCAAELAPEKFLECGADITFTNPDKKLFPTAPTGVNSREIPFENFAEKSLSEFPFRTRAFIKIQEGCDNFCSYCIVPYVRGASRSRKFAECIADCQHAIDAGFPEIVFTGVNTCNYFDDGKDLIALIREVAALPGNFRIRLSSTEPHPDDLSIPELMADPANKLCRFLHLSMQHGSDPVLAAMRRNYTSGQFIDFVTNVRALVPDIHIGSDFIIGFPGETEADFIRLLEVVNTVKFANIHPFAYSIRPGTPAAVMPGQVPAMIVKQRMKLLADAAGNAAVDFARSQLGKTLPVIFEQEKNNILHGWSDNYLSICVPSGSFPTGKIVNIKADEKNLAENLQKNLSDGIL